MHAEFHSHLLLEGQCTCVFLLAVFLLFLCSLGVLVCPVPQLLLTCDYYRCKVFFLCPSSPFSGLVFCSPMTVFPFSLLAVMSICIFPYTAVNQKQYHITNYCSAFSHVSKRFGEVFG